MEYTWLKRVGDGEAAMFYIITGPISYCPNCKRCLECFFSYCIDAIKWIVWYTKILSCYINFLVCYFRSFMYPLRLQDLAFQTIFDRHREQSNLTACPRLCSNCADSDQHVPVRSLIRHIHFCTFNL